MYTCATPVLAYLRDGRALEHDEHEQRKETVIPVLVQTPQRDAEDLEHKEWRGRMLAEQLEEARHRDIELVLSVQARGGGELGGGEAFGHLVRRQRRLA